MQKIWRLYLKVQLLTQLTFNQENLFTCTSSSIMTSIRGINSMITVVFLKNKMPWLFPTPSKKTYTHNYLHPNSIEEWTTFMQTRDVQKGWRLGNLNRCYQPSSLWLQHIDGRYWWWRFMYQWKVINRRWCYNY